MDKWATIERRQQAAFRSTNKLQVSYQHSTCVRYSNKAAACVVCMPCGILACLGRLVTCSPGGSSLTAGCDGCILQVCAAIDEVEPDHYDLIRSGQDQDVVKAVLAEWVTILEDAVQRARTGFKLNVLTLINRISVICTHMPVRNERVIEQVMTLYMKVVSSHEVVSSPALLDNIDTVCRAVREGVVH